MDYGKPSGNGLSEQPHVSGIIQRGSQSPTMGLEMTDARASQTQTPPHFGGTDHGLNITGSYRMRTYLSVVYLDKTTATSTCLPVHGKKDHPSSLSRLPWMSMLGIERVKETVPRDHILPSDQHHPGWRLSAPDPSRFSRNIPAAWGHQARNLTTKQNPEPCAVLSSCLSNGDLQASPRLPLWDSFTGSLRC